MDQERLNAFQARMSNWVSRQGLFFQLRYASSVKGAESTVFGALMRLIVRLAILLLLVLLGFWVFLVVRVDFGWFRTDLGENISNVLRADAAVVGSVRRDRGEMVLPKVSLEGGEESFFYDAELRDVRTRMGLLDGVLKDWNGEVVQVRELILTLKSGADTREEAEASFAALFRRPDNFAFRTIEVESTTLTWGYSELHRGAIEGSRLKATVREGGGWDLVFTGGLFTQNWLRRFTIERIEVTVTEEGLEIPRLALSREGGTIELSGRMTSGGARPAFEGSGRMVSVPLWSLVGSTFREFLDGRISGDLEFSGSTNSQDGFSTRATVDLDGGDFIVLEDRFPLFRAISAVDRLRSYKKVRFASGSFEMETGNDRLELTGVDLRAQDLMRLQGDLVVRRPTNEEREEALAPEGATVGKTGEDGQEVAPVEEEKDLTLLEAAKFLKENEAREAAGGGVILGSVRDRPGVGGLAAGEPQRTKQDYYLEGLLRLGITSDVFDRSPDLDAAFPVDGESGWRWLELQVDGRIFTVGADLANRIYLQSRGEP